MGAIKSSLQHLHAETGLVKGTKLMLNANQINGFDCPGCAWPDPDEKRSFASSVKMGPKQSPKKQAINELRLIFLLKIV